MSSPMIVVAAAPEPVPSVVLNVTVGATVYPDPGFTTLTPVSYTHLRAHETV